MTLRALFLADGPSDEPLGAHVGHLARQHGVDLDVVTPDLRRLDPPPGLQVAARVAAVLAFDDAFDLVIVHRDAEGQTPSLRYAEVRAGVDTIRPGLASIPVVPVRMTESWLLVNEEAIRLVAGRPTGTMELNLPQVGSIEQLPNPKATLRRVLETASGAQGRRLQAFRRDFGTQRRRLLEMLDRSGPVTVLSGWQELERTVATVVTQV